jgi:hypothetical protein
MRIWKKLWATYADGNRYYAPTISRLDNGDFLITGRMMSRDSMFTRAMRTFDFDGMKSSITLWFGTATENSITIS